MRKTLIIGIIFFTLSIFIVGCNKVKPEEERDIVKSEETRAIFISYIELMNYVKGQDNKTSKENIDMMINNIKDLNLNSIILQVRSFSDAIYKSKIFPWSFTVSNKEGEDPGYDILDYFIKQSHKKGIKLHVWINPYRIRTYATKEEISTGNPAFKWLETDNVHSIPKGIFYNPASKEVEDLIVSGVKEIIDNYDVDGVHFDDYFYPGENIDQKEYEEYVKTHPDVSIDQFRLNNVNHLVKRVYKTIKDKDKNIMFGISPEGNIENNYSENYADVYTWGASSEYVDYLMPQIYYGLINEAKPYIETTLEWENVIQNKKIKLLPALAFYKVGTVDEYAKGGSTEWIDNSDIIMKQILLGRNLKNYDGFALFRYDNIFNQELATSTTFTEIENMKKILK